MHISVMHSGSEWAGAGLTSGLPDEIDDAESSNLAICSHLWLRLLKLLAKPLFNLQYMLSFVQWLGSSCQTVKDICHSWKCSRLQSSSPCCC